MNLLARRRELMMGGSGLLPSGYTAYDWIERQDTDDTSYIDVDLYPNRSKLWTFSGKFARIANFGSNYTMYAIFSKASGSYNSSYGIYRHAKNYNQLRFGYNSRPSIETYSGLSSVTINIGVWYDFELTSNDEINYGGQLTIDNTTDTYNAGSNSNSDATTSLKLLRGYECRLARFYVYYDANLIADLVPAVRDSDSVAGYYDVVRTSFYAPTGNGAFTAGNGLEDFNT